jgi:hypothetical protein
MGIEAVYQEVVNLFERHRLERQEKLGKMDKLLDELRLQDVAHPALDVLERERMELRAQLDELNIEVDRVSNLAAGVKLNEGVGSATFKLRPGQYKNVRRLATAVTAVLLHYPGNGPIKIAELAEMLHTAGVTVQVRNGKNKGQRVPIEATNIRIMCSNYNSGFRKTKGESPFVYDKREDRISLQN